VNAVPGGVVGACLGQGGTAGTGGTRDDRGGRGVQVGEAGHGGKRVGRYRGRVHRLAIEPGRRRMRGRLGTRCELQHHFRLHRASKLAVGAAAVAAKAEPLADPVDPDGLAA
jgi:hypothetical protein